MKYVLKRILYAIPALLFVVVIIFVLTRVLPGDPARMYVGEQADEEAVEMAREELGLNDPYPQQFVDYINDLIHGDLGYSWSNQENVLDGFKQRLPATLELVIFAVFLAVVIGVPIGVLSATRKNSFWDHVSRLISLLGASMPSFWVGLMLIVVFYATLNIVPAPMGRLSIGVNAPTAVTGLYVLDSILSGDLIALKDSLAHLILPGVTLSFSTMAVVARMTRASMLEVLELDFVRTARSKGMREGKVIWKHAFSNSLIPVLTAIGGQFGFLIGFGVVVETIFAWPGIGTYVTDAIMYTDYTPIQGFALLSAVIYLIINLILDLLYTIVDPRVHYD